MPGLRNRNVIVVLSLLFIVTFVIVIVWRISVAHQSGWMGFAFSPGIPDKQRQKMPDLGFMTPKPGQVVTIIEGSPAHRAGIRAGDAVMSVANIPLADHKRIALATRDIGRGDSLPYRVSSNGVERDVTLTAVSPLTFPLFTITVAVMMLVALVFMATSVIVYWRARVRSRAAWVFYWLCNVMALLFAVDLLREIEVSTYRGLAAVQSDARFLVVYGLYFFIGMFVPALLLHLALVFPAEQRIVREHPLVLRWVHTILFTPVLAVIPVAVIITPITRKSVRFAILGVLIVGAGVMLYWLRRRSANWRSALLDHPWLAQLSIVTIVIGSLLFVVRLAFRNDPMVGGIFLGIIITALYGMLVFGMAAATLYSLYTSYRNSDVEAKRQVRWPLWGTALTVTITAIMPLITMIATWWTKGIIDSRLMLATMVVSRLAYIFIPVSFAFGILKHRLMDIDVIIRKTVVYSVVTAFVVIAFFLLVAGLGAFVTSILHIEDQTVTIIATLVLALTFVPLRNRVQRFVDRRFFQRRYDATEAEKLIQQEIVDATELQPLLRKVAEYVQQVLQTRSVLILSEADDRNRFVVQGSIGVPDEALRRFSIDRDTLARVDSIIPAGDLRLSQEDWAAMKRVNAEVVVPAKLRGELRGVMVVGSMLAGTFDEDDRAFLERVAQQVAFGVDGLTLSDDMREFEAALDIQRAMMPKTMPRDDGIEIDASWQPARIVGGDYFDVLQLGPNTLGLCIADVAGKGMPAALLMANLQAAVKASATDTMSPSEVCERVRKVVCGTLSGGRFVTFFFAMIDTQQMVMRYANAGHNPPLLVKASGELLRLDTGGPALARLMQSTAYESGQETLDAGDVLFLYTDGVTEARSASEEEFGDDRLVEVIRNAQPNARNIVRDVVADVRAFSGGVAHDDVTIVCARVTRGAAENVVPFPRVS